MNTIPTTGQLIDLADQFLENEGNALFELIGTESIYNEFVEARSNPDETFLLHRLLLDARKFAFDAEEVGDEEWKHHQLSAFMQLELDEALSESTKSQRADVLKDLLTLHRARITLEFGDDATETLDRDELALLSNYSPETLRLAAYAEGEDQLAQERGGIIQLTEAKRWLKHKGAYKPMTKLAPVVLKPEHPARNNRELFESIISQIHRHPEYTPTQMFDFFGETAQPGWQHFLEHRHFDPNHIEWVTPANARKLGETIKLDSIWLFENAHRLSAETVRQHLVRELLNREPEPELFEAPADEPISRELIRRVLRSRPDIQRHPAQNADNKKLDGYVSDKGVAFAHQHETKSQFFWVPAELTIEDERLVTTYPATSQTDTAGRHSGLLKFPELGRTAVKKVRIPNGAVLNDLLRLLHDGAQEER